MWAVYFVLRTKPPPNHLAIIFKGGDYLSKGDRSGSSRGYFVTTLTTFLVYFCPPEGQKNYLDNYLLFWSTLGSYVAHGMRMSVSAMFFVLIATPPGPHGGSCLVVHSGHPPHIVTHLIHEYHVDIPWICMPSCGFHDGRWVGEIWGIWCALGWSV